MDEAHRRLSRTEELCHIVTKLFHLNKGKVIIGSDSNVHAYL